MGPPQGPQGPPGPGGPRGDWNRPPGMAPHQMAPPGSGFAPHQQGPPMQGPPPGQGKFIKLEHINYIGIRTKELLIKCTFF